MKGSEVAEGAAAAGIETGGAAFVVAGAAIVGFGIYEFAKACG